ncbi:metal ABC transporter permease [Bradyrhizobium sp. NAS80.1]|uniref:metal ABC transporter permease n=1 Tax=Bradyrhizobium sp. NAS80.1 TaxID=1680159 RepID=UPI000A00F9B5|nr:metal ABC transporter permease [Bradyrhizobium sp. NAS80.1]
MSQAIAFLWPAFLVSVCLVGIHAYFGIQVLARKVIFVDLALAQIAALGATVAFMLGHPAQSPATYAYSLAFTLLASVLLAFTRLWATRVPQEALIGVIYVVAAAVSILLIDRAPQGAEHLKQILTGNILFAGIGELHAIAPLYAAIGLLHFLLRRRLTGAGSLVWEFFFFATFGVVVTSSVAIAGVLLVFSFLIVPAAIGAIFARSFATQLAIGWAVGTLSSAVGLAASFAFDLPTGAAMVCTFGGALGLSGVLYAVLHSSRRTAWRMAIAAARWSMTAILAGSALQLVVAPRTDQPVLDAAEYIFPSLRTIYLTRGEQSALADASEHAERYRTEAERLNDMEGRSRSEGEALDDFTVARISSLLRSYGEMRNGEQFVMTEVRGRARQRVRWTVSFALLALALLVSPGPWRRMWAQARVLRLKGRPE